MAEKKTSSKPTPKNNSKGGGAKKKAAPPLGTGARFKGVEESARQGGAADPKAVAAAAGNAKYGKAAMQKMAQAGGKKNAKKKS